MKRARETERKWYHSSIRWFTPQMHALVGTGQSWSQDPEFSSQFPILVTGTKYFSHNLNASQHMHEQEAPLKWWLTPSYYSLLLFLFEEAGLVGWKDRDRNGEKKEMRKETLLLVYFQIAQELAQSLVKARIQECMLVNVSGRNQITWTITVVLQVCTSRKLRSGTKARCWTQGSWYVTWVS